MLRQKNKMSKTIGAIRNRINFLLEFIADIPNELIKCVGMQIDSTCNLNLHNDEAKKKRMRSISIILNSVHGNYGQMIHDISSSQHPVNIFCDEDNMT